MTQRDLLALLLLVLAVVSGVQYGRFHLQVDGVEKTVRSLIPEFHQRGVDVYRERLVDQLAVMGLTLTQEDLDLVEDPLHDEFRVVVRYSWPLKVLVWEFPRTHEYGHTVPLYALTTW